MRIRPAPRSIRRALCWLVALVALLGTPAGATNAAPAATLAGLPLARPASVSVEWRDGSALATWPAVPGADGYLVSLIRLRDQAIMAQQRVPTAQPVADLPGLWPGEQYVVAVQALDAANDSGRPGLSQPGASVPLSTAAAYGFLDDALQSPGPLDASLWDQRALYASGPTYGGAYAAGSGQTELVAGCPAGTACYGQLAVTTLRARAPFDWHGRTLTVRGEVDLKGDTYQSFGAILAPQVVGPTRVLDLGQRFFQPVALPMIELYSARGQTSLLYSAGYGAFPMVLARVPNPTGITGVRDDIVWRVSTTHTRVQLDGVTVFDLDWPTALPYTTGYLSLFAEDDPHAGSGAQPVCDDAPNPCAVWHLGPWGFDAPTGDAAQPATAAYMASGCDTTAVAAPDSLAPAADCDAADVSAGSSASYSVPVAGAPGLASAAVLFDASNLTVPGSLTLGVNGGAAIGVPDVVADSGQSGSGAFESYRVPISPSLLASGDNRVTFQLQNVPSGEAVTIANVQIETAARAPAPARIPVPEPAPLSYWTAGLA